jgi:hypothetical protein
LDEVRTALVPAGLNIRRIVPYDLFSENAIAQAKLAARYPEWLSEIRELLSEPQCRQFWRRFEQVELPKLHESTGRRFILLCEKGLTPSLDISDPVAPPPVTATSAIRRSLELFREVYGDFAPSEVPSAAA